MVSKRRIDRLNALNLHFLWVLVVIYLFLFAPVRALAQQQHYEFLHLSLNDGLSNSQVLNLMQDRKGYLWIGTLSGLNRYDGYNFKTFRHQENDSTSIRDNYIEGIYEDHLGRIWVDIPLGFNIYDPIKDQFLYDQEQALMDLGVVEKQIRSVYTDRFGNFLYLGTKSGVTIFSPSSGTYSKISHAPGDSLSIRSNSIQDIKQDVEGNYWLIYDDGAIEQYDAEKGKVVFKTTFFESNQSNLLSYRMFIDSEGDVWVYSSDAWGVLRIMHSSGERKFYNASSSHFKLSNSMVRGITEDNDGQIWIATDHGGINILNKKAGQVNYILHNEEDERSLGHNSIYSIVKDKTGIIWIGTFKKGISYYHPDLIKFRHFKHEISNPNSLGFDDINCFEEDEKGNLWIGTNGGGLIYFDRKENIFKSYRHDPRNPNSLGNDVIVNMFRDSEGTLWIGTFYGGLDRFDGKRFTHFKHNPDDPASINDDRVYEIFEDADGNLWIGTLSGSLQRFNKKSQTFEDFSSLLPSDYISSITEDEDDKLWIASAYGLIVFNRKSHQIKHYLHDFDFPNTLSNDNLTFIYRDSRDLMWIGSRDGLNLYNEKEDNFRVFKGEEGLCDNTIQAITEDALGNLWVTTTNGVSNLIIHAITTDTVNIEVRNYDKADGLQGPEFNLNGIFTTSKGEVVFGGHEGMNIVNPAEIEKFQIEPQLVLTGLQIFNSNVRVGEHLDGRIVLSKAIEYTSELELKYEEKIFSIEFAGLTLIHPDEYKFQYKLEGFNSDWVEAESNQRKAIYTNLDPGEYTFKVRIVGSDGSQAGSERSLNISISPPFWRTGIAFFIYLLVIFGVLLIGRQIILERERLKFEIKRERFEANRMHELDMMKIRFFTNISHEFRTPLMLILNPIEKMIMAVHEPEQNRQLQLISRNAKRLMKLVNQLLDFRKMEVEELRLNPSGGDVIKFIKDIAETFTDLSESSNIDFRVHTTVDELEMLFDHDKLEKIIYNLLSNAFKFTPSGHSVELKVEIEYNNEQQARNIHIYVIDTGIGIPSEMHDKIFDRFFQSDQPNASMVVGSGIGLALTKEFVNLHDGIISVDSEADKGSTFKVTIPVKFPHQFELDQAIKNYVSNKANKENGKELVTNGQRKPLVLLVEDNDDFRFYLKDNLRHQYEILEASNGKEAWEIAEGSMPDLVVSDIVMPEVDGIELCKKIKADHKTSHIPVILLSAQVGETNKLKGFEVGADDYITKPFNFEILIYRIKNLITLRESLKKNYNKQIEIGPREIAITSLDEALIQKALTIVENNISNPDFSVEELSRELGMSRVHLYKKLSSLTGKSPIEFIRIIRLKRAAMLLEKSQLTVSEVAYKVGFNNPKYFSKYFKAEYKMLPSAYSGKSKV